MKTLLSNGLGQSMKNRNLSLLLRMLSFAHVFYHFSRSLNVSIFWFVLVVADVTVVIVCLHLLLK